jgi:hypothetical protein
MSRENLLAVLEHIARQELADEIPAWVKRDHADLSEQEQLDMWQEYASDYAYEHHDDMILLAREALASQCDVPESMVREQCAPNLTEAYWDKGRMKVRIANLIANADPIRVPKLEQWMVDFYNARPRHGNLDLHSVLQEEQLLHALRYHQEFPKNWNQELSHYLTHNWYGTNDWLFWTSDYHYQAVERHAQIACWWQPQLLSAGSQGNHEPTKGTGTLIADAGYYVAIRWADYDDEIAFEIYSIKDPTWFWICLEEPTIWVKDEPLRLHAGTGEMWFANAEDWTDEEFNKKLEDLGYWFMDKDLLRNVKRDRSQI